MVASGPSLTTNQISALELCSLPNRSFLRADAWKPPRECFRADHLGAKYDPRNFPNCCVEDESLGCSLGAEGSSRLQPYGKMVGEAFLLVPVSYFPCVQPIGALLYKHSPIYHPPRYILRRPPQVPHNISKVAAIHLFSYNTTTMSILFYKRPDYVAKVQGPMNLTQCQIYVERTQKHRRAIPPELSFENVIQNRALPPCALQDFMVGILPTKTQSVVLILIGLCRTTSSCPLLTTIDAMRQIPRSTPYNTSIFRFQDSLYPFPRVSDAACLPHHT